MFKSAFFCLGVYKGRALILLLVSLFSQPVFSQTSEKTGSWSMYFGQFRFHNNWSIYTEAQHRDYGILNETQQILLRTGINFHCNSISSFTAGYAHVINHPEDNTSIVNPAVVVENRLWQQFNMRNNIGRILFDHRYRTEQRWIGSNNNTRYLNRLRYLLRATVPLNKKEIEENTVFLSVYNEVFLHISPVPFDRNRLYGAIGYQFLPKANIQLGYLAQTVNTTTRHYLQAALFYNFDLRRIE